MSDLQQLIDEFEQEHGSGSQMSTEEATDADLADLRTRIHGIAMDWDSAEIQRQRDIQKKMPDTPARRAVIDGLQAAANDKAVNGPPPSPERIRRSRAAPPTS